MVPHHPAICRVSRPAEAWRPFSNALVGQAWGVPTTSRPLRRLAIVNRGEAAMRAINAVRELNEEAAEPIRVIALYTEPERYALFVRQADEAYCLGPATGERGSAASSAASSMVRSFISLPK